MHRAARAPARRPARAPPSCSPSARGRADRPRRRRPRRGARRPPARATTRSLPVSAMIARALALEVRRQQHELVGLARIRQHHARRRRGVIMPRSPCAASAGCTKNAGVPVDASVAASLRATWPGLADARDDDASAAVAASASTAATNGRAEPRATRGDRARLGGEHVARERQRARRRRRTGAAGGAAPLRCWAHAESDDPCRREYNVGRHAPGARRCRCCCRGNARMRLVARPASPPNSRCRKRCN